MPQPRSPTGQSAWIDLLRLLKQDEVSDFRGAPRLRKINGKAYWYDQYRTGDRIKDRYLGEDSADLRARIAQYKELHETQKERATARERLMRILRAEDYLTPDLATVRSCTPSLVSRCSALGLRWSARMLSEPMRVCLECRSGLISLQ